MNGISLSRLALVHPALRYRVTNFLTALPFDTEVTQGLRTWAEQDALYAQGRTVPGIIVTNARGGYSMHNMGGAIDIVPEDITPGQPDWNLNHPAWKTILQMALKFGLAEGAQWAEDVDSPHLYLQELPATPTDQMRSDFSAGGLPQVWAAWRIGNV